MVPASSPTVATPVDPNSTAVAVTEAPSDTQPVSTKAEAPKKLSKIEEKRLRQLQERFKRIKNDHPDWSPQQIMQEIERQNYEALPVDKKLEHFKGLMAQSLRSVFDEINNLRYNDGVLADSMDLNFKAFTKILDKLGVSPEEQKKYILEAEAEIKADREKAAAARDQGEKTAQKEAADTSEKARVEEAMKAAETKVDLGGTDANGSPVPPPDGATVFGG